MEWSVSATARTQEIVPAGREVAAGEDQAQTRNIVIYPITLLPLHWVVLSFRQASRGGGIR